jgi:hypothetical protein
VLSSSEKGAQERQLEMSGRPAQPLRFGQLVQRAAAVADPQQNVPERRARRGVSGAATQELLEIDDRRTMITGRRAFLRAREQVRIARSDGASLREDGAENERERPSRPATPSAHAAIPSIVLTTPGTAQWNLRWARIPELRRAANCCAVPGSSGVRQTPARTGFSGQYYL